ncbi:MAG TPA: hypothetical protein VFS00_13165 [Polyangiaceae bacterium]|nr:hypothetical protein [Polyangiaceae bacterium]
MLDVADVADAADVGGAADAAGAKNAKSAAGAKNAAGAKSLAKAAGAAGGAKAAKTAGERAAVGARLDAASVGAGPKAAGRGAHAHARPSCLRAAAQKGLSRSFRRPVRAPAEALAGAVREASLGRAWALLRGAFARGQASAEAGGAGALAVVACDCPPSDFGPALREAVGRGEAVALGRRESLGGLAGRGALSMVFVRDAGVAKKIAWACAVADGAGPGRAVAEVG